MHVKAEVVIFVRAADNIFTNPCPSPVLNSRSFSEVRLTFDGAALQWPACPAEVMPRWPLLGHDAWPPCQPSVKDEWMHSCKQGHLVVCKERYNHHSSQPHIADAWPC